MDDVSVRRRTLEAYSPLVLCAASPKTRHLCAQNGVTPADLLRPLLQVKVNKTLSTQTGPFTLQEFRLRVLDVEELREVPFSQAEENLWETLHNADPLGKYGFSADLVRNLQDSQFLAHNVFTKSSYAPWYTAARASIHRNFKCQDHHLFDMPLALFVMVSSSDEDFVGEATRLQRCEHLECFESGLYPKIPCKVGFVFDDVAPATSTESVIHQLRAQSGIGMWRPVTMDSRAANPKEAASSPGPAISDTGIARLQAAVQDCVKSQVCRALENRLARLNDYVINHRKGLRNAIKAWWRKPKESSASVVTSASKQTAYPHDSSESIVRQLADLSIMIGDFENADQMYRLVKEDFKSDGALLNQGNCIEMSALCEFALEGASVSIASQLQQAADCYYRAASVLNSKGSGALFTSIPRTMSPMAQQRLALTSDEAFKRRCIRIASNALMSAAEVLLLCPGSNRPREAAALYNKAAMAEGDGSPLFAVLCEQAAVCNLRYSIPQFRSYISRLCFAGQQYSKQQLARHATRCFSQALSCYGKGIWPRIDMIVYRSLAKHLGDQHVYGSAIGYLTHTITRCAERVTPKEQHDMLMALKSYYEQSRALPHADNPLLRPTPDRNPTLPTVDDSSFQLVSWSNSAAAAAFIEAAPNSMSNIPSLLGFGVALDPWSGSNQCEGDVTRFARPDFRNSWESMHDMMKRYSSLKQQGHDLSCFDWCKLIDDVVHSMEQKAVAPMRRKNPVTVAIGKAPHRWNGEPFAVLLKFSNPLQVPLEVSHLHLECQVEGESTPFTARPSWLQCDGYETTNCSWCFEPLSSATICFFVIPHCIGSLHIKRVRWQSAGAIEAVHELKLKGPPLAGAGARTQQKYAVDRRLECRVSAASAKVSIECLQTPFRCPVAVGEVLHFDIRMRNTGVSPITSLYLLTERENGVFLCFPQASASDDRLEGLSGEFVDVLQRYHASAQLAPGECVLIRASCRIASADASAARFLVKFMCDDSNVPRFVQWEEPVHVRDAVAVHALITPAGVTPDAYTAVCTVARGISGLHGQSGSALRLQSISCVSSAWHSKMQVCNETALPCEMQPSASQSVLLELNKSETGSPLQPGSEQAMHMRIEAAHSLVMKLTNTASKRERRHRLESEAIGAKAVTTVSVRTESRVEQLKTSVPFSGMPWQENAILSSTSHVHWLFQGEVHSADSIAPWALFCVAAPLHAVDSTFTSNKVAALEKLPVYLRQLSEPSDQVFPVSCAIDVPPYLAHNFEEGSLTTQIRVYLTNRTSQSISLRLRVTDTAVSAKGTDYSVSKGLVWTNVTTTDILTVSPNGRVCIPLSAMILKEGVYEFNQFCVELEGGNMHHLRSIHFPNQCLSFVGQQVPSALP